MLQTLKLPVLKKGRNKAPNLGMLLVHSVWSVLGKQGNAVWYCVQRQRFFGCKGYLVSHTPFVPGARCRTFLS